MFFKYSNIVFYLWSSTKYKELNICSYRSGFLDLGFNTGIYHLQKQNIKSRIIYTMIQIPKSVTQATLGSLPQKAVGTNSLHVY
ncbi:hypothetical protein NQ315_007327 [Exocentrus adspersus]|uniref:Uncharacterized protein n=1 Tax=Exocentrus adspersus TaxID=1586481 RepID=A0AAV8WD97_9CUCU|nr:hypothetical protein NQ315_007327 [Exocentrus adspersus]